MELKMVGSMTVGGKKFSLKDSDGAITPSSLKLADNWYGGMVKTLYKTKEGFYMCADNKNNLINLAYYKNKLTDKGKALLEGQALSGDVEQLKPIEELDRKELLKLAKELGVEGKLATFSTEDLKIKIKEYKGEHSDTEI